MPTPRELLAAAKSADHRGLAVRSRRTSSAVRSSWTSARATSTTRERSPAPSTSPGASSSSTSRDAFPTRPPASSSTAPAGVRSAFAARTLAELGYETSSRWPAGSTAGRTRDSTFDVPRTLAPDQRERYHRHLLLPEVGEQGQLQLLDAKVLLLGAGGLGSPAALYLAAAGVGTLGIVDMDVVDASNLQRQILHNLDRVGERKVDSAKKTLTAMNPDVIVVDLRRPPRRGQRAVDHRGLRPHRRRHRQLPDALPRERRVGRSRHPRRARLDLPVRGPGHGLRPDARSVLPLPAARAAAGRARTELRRGRRARRPPGDHRLDPGARGDQDPARPRRPADRPAAHLRRARGVVPHVHGCARTRSARRAASTPASSCSPTTTSSACPTRARDRRAVREPARSSPSFAPGSSTTPDPRYEAAQRRAPRARPRARRARRRQDLHRRGRRARHRRHLRGPCEPRALGERPGAPRRTARSGSEASTRRTRSRSRTAPGSSSVRPTARVP